MDEIGLNLVLMLTYLTDLVAGGLVFFCHVSIESNNGNREVAISIDEVPNIIY